MARDIRKTAFRVLQPVAYFLPMGSVQNLSVSPSRITNTGQRPCNVPMHSTSFLYSVSSVSTWTKFDHPKIETTLPIESSEKAYVSVECNKRDRDDYYATSNHVLLWTGEISGFRLTVDKVFALTECDAACVGK